MLTHHKDHINPIRPKIKVAKTVLDRNCLQLNLHSHGKMWKYSVPTHFRFVLLLLCLTCPLLPCPIIHQVVRVAVNYLCTVSRRQTGLHWSLRLYLLPVVICSCELGPIFYIQRHDLGRLQLAPLLSELIASVALTHKIQLHMITIADNHEQQSVTPWHVAPFCWRYLQILGIYWLIASMSTLSSCLLVYRQSYIHLNISISNHLKGVLILCLREILEI